MANNVWPGSGSAASGSTSFGFYDNEVSFQTDAPKVADWCARRLGYPIVEVELIDLSFYACFEEAITEYSAQVNQFNIRNNLLLLVGTPTASVTNLSNTYIKGSPVPFTVAMSEAYGTEAGSGGTVDWKRGSIGVTEGTQDYDLNALWAAVSESGSAIEIKRVFHDRPPAVSRFFDPFALTGQGYTNLIEDFGFGGYSPTAQFLLMPIHEDILRIQGIEFNDMVRKSAYSFELVNNKIRLFPVPKDTTTLWFEYIVKADRDSALLPPTSSMGTVISDYSNIPYENIPYVNINGVGKQWIKKYTLALCKELLGAVRQKYDTIPIPDAEINLDGGELRAEAQIEKEALITQLRENLESLTRKSQMEEKALEAQQHQEMLQKIPFAHPIYIF